VTRPTPSQTVGPFFHIGLPSDGQAELVAADAGGAIRIERDLIGESHDLDLVRGLDTPGIHS